jgi:hypothetical protein
MQAIEEERGGEQHHHGEEAAPDTMRMVPDTGAAHQHAMPDTAKR